VVEEAGGIAVGDSSGALHGLDEEYAD